MRPFLFRFTGASERTTDWHTRFSVVALLAACLLIGTFLSPSIARAQTTPAATNQIQIAGLTMIDQQHGWAFDERYAHIYVTQQGPAHWRDVTPPQLGSGSNTTVTTSFFPTASRGYLGIMQNQQILLLSTQDSGKTWQSTPFTLSSSTGLFHIYQISFLDAQHGWLVFSGSGPRPGSANIVLMSTSDGDKTWQTLLNTVQNPQSLPLPYGQTIQFTFANLQQGWATGIGLSADVYLYSTHDGGKTWSQASIAPIKGSNSIYFTQAYGPFWQNKHTGTLFVKFDTSSGNGMPHLTTYQTRDAGQTWLLGPSSPATSYGEFNVFSFLNAWQGWSFGFDGQGQYILHHTSTGGQSWDIIHPDGLIKPDANGQALGGLTFLNPQTGWVWIKDSQNTWHLFQTNNGGHSWCALQPVAN